MSDLAALTPPLLVCAAFLIAVAAFIRHEMRRSKNSAEEETVEVSTQVPDDDSSENAPGSGASTQSVGDGQVDPESDFDR